MFTDNRSRSLCRLQRSCGDANGEAQRGSRNSVRPRPARYAAARCHGGLGNVEQKRHGGELAFSLCHLAHSGKARRGMWMSGPAGSLSVCAAYARYMHKGGLSRLRWRGCATRMLKGIAFGRATRSAVFCCSEGQGAQGRRAVGLSECFNTMNMYFVHPPSICLRLACHGAQSKGVHLTLRAGRQD